MSLVSKDLIQPNFPKNIYEPSTMLVSQHKNCNKPAHDDGY